eukprot:13420898-Ditylum_brightwellii.AAC.1
MEDASKQAYALVWGQCSMPMRERICSNKNYVLFLDKEDVIKLLKAIKSSVFKFEEDDNLYMSIGCSAERFWRFYQPKNMSNLTCLEKFKNLINVCEENGGNIGKHLACFKANKIKVVGEDRRTPDEVAEAVRVAQLAGKEKFLAR